jgi:hypothetical protein
MTLENLARRMGATLSLCSLPILVVAAVCWLSASGQVAEEASIHHMFGLTFALMGFVLFVAGAALSSLALSTNPAGPGQDVGSREPA